LPKEKKTTKGQTTIFKTYTQKTNDQVTRITYAWRNKDCLSLVFFLI